MSECLVRTPTARQITVSKNFTGQPRILQFKISVIELVVQQQSETVSVLAHSTQNGKISRLTEKPDAASPLNACLDDISSVYGDTTQAHPTKKDITFATSSWTQFTILLGRMLLQMKRNKTMLWIQLLHHVISGLLVGGIFFGIGDDASQVLANFKYCVSIVAFFMYTHVMVPVLICKS